jgi:hypothetical protein
MMINVCVQAFTQHACQAGGTVGARSDASRVHVSIAQGGWGGDGYMHL